MTSTWQVRGLGLVAVLGLLGGAPAWAQGSSVLTGTVIDSATKKPVPDAVVTATSPSLPGEQTVVTDKSGGYRIPQLPPGTYTLRIEGDGYKPYERTDIQLRNGITKRINVELLQQGIHAPSQPAKEPAKKDQRR